MNPRRSRRQPTADEGLRARLESIHLPPLRFGLRHEPTDVPDGHPTLHVQPIAPKLAVEGLLAATPTGCSTLLVDAARRLQRRGSRLSSSVRSRLVEAQLSRSLLVDPAHLCELAPELKGRVSIARIEGPVDAADALALEEALRGGTPPLDADLRTQALLQASPCGALWSQWRSARDARDFAVRLLVRYVAAAASLDRAELDIDCAETRTTLFPVVDRDRRLRASDVRVEESGVSALLRSRDDRPMRLHFDRTIRRWLVILRTRHDSRA